MFQKENVDFLNILHKQNENHAEIIKQFGQMGKTISELKESFAKSTSEILILQPFEQTFSSNGYKYNSIYVGDAAAADNAKLIVALNGVMYTIPLAPGENAVNIPDRATFKATTNSGFAPSVLLSRYNVPGVDNNVTVTNTPGVTLAGRNVSYQRILVNQSITANGVITTTLDLGKLGTKALNLVYSCVGTAFLSVFPCDVNGNKLTGGQPIGVTNQTGYTNNALIINEVGGVRYLGIYLYDKSGVANTSNFVDITWTVV